MLRPLPALCLIALVLAAAPAGARTMLTGSPFGTGLIEPLVVLEHLAGLLAIGIWAGQNSGPAAWQMPVAALGAALAAGLAANLGVSLPYAGIALAASVIVAGVLAAVAVRLPLVAAVPAAAVLGLLHGFMAGGSALFWVGYASGMLLTLSAGLGLTAVLGMPLSPRVVQACGGGAALAGLVDLIGRI